MSDPEKSAVLLGALKDDEARGKARTAINGTATFQEAMDQFSKHYEDPRDLMSRHLNKLLQTEPVGPNKADLDRLRTVIRDTENSLKAFNSYTMEQFIPAYMESKLDPSLFDEWRKLTLGQPAPPKTDAFDKFLLDQMSRVGVEPVSAVKLEDRIESKWNPNHTRRRTLIIHLLAMHLAKGCSG